MQGAPEGARVRGAGWLVVLWGVGGILALLAQALVRLSPYAVEAAELGMRWWQWALGAAWVLFSAYAEGHRGFHLRFAPRVVARAFHLARAPRPLHALLAPAYCMSFFHATRRGQTVAWSMTAAIVAAVVLVRLLPQPWRGLVDAGVVVGLGWGVLSILFHAARAVRRFPDAPSDLPDPAASART